MAGSWRHATAPDGRLLDNERAVSMLENGGDWYEFAREAYGMVVWLAQSLTEKDGLRGSLISGGAERQAQVRRSWIRQAQEHFADGVRIGGVAGPSEELSGDEDDEPLPTFPIYARFSYPDADLPAAQVHARSYLVPGRVYTIRRMEVGRSDTWLEFWEHPGERFSTTMFTPERENYYEPGDEEPLS